MFAILIADKMSPNAVSSLEDLGAKVTLNPDLGADDLPQAIGNHNVLIVRSTKVTAATLDAAKSLELVIRAGAGVNTIDLDRASTLGISVANCPGKNMDAVAELAMGLIIAADRRIVDACSDLRDGKWRKKAYQKAGGLKGRTLGVIGLGSIGGALLKIAQGMGMEVVCWSRSLTPEKAEELEVGYCSSREEVAEVSDVISVHLAAGPETKNCINSDFFAKMKDGAIFVNTSRGDIVDNDALKAAIENKGLRVGLDVFADEPGGGEAEFDQTDLASRVTCTPHIGASTDQASEAIADEAVRIVKELVRTGKAPNTVNIRQTASELSTLLVRHYNRVGVLASVLDILRKEDVNIEEMDNSIFSGNKAAVACLKIDKAPSQSALDEMTKNESIIQVEVK